MCPFFLHAPVPMHHCRAITPNHCPEASKVAQWRPSGPMVLLSGSSWSPCWISNFHPQISQLTSKFSVVVGSKCTPPPFLSATLLSASVSTCLGDGPGTQITHYTHSWSIHNTFSLLWMLKEIKRVHLKLIQRYMSITSQ